MTRRRRLLAGRRRDRQAAQVLAKLSVGRPAARDRVVELVRVLLPEEAAQEATQPSRVGIVGRAATLDDVLRPLSQLGSIAARRTRLSATSA